MSKTSSITKKKINSYLNENRAVIPDHLLEIFREAEHGSIGELVVFARQVVSGAHVPIDKKLGWRIYKELLEIKDQTDFPEYIEYNYAMSKNEKQEFTESLEIMNGLAKKNYLPAITRLGTFYDYGNFGVEADPVKALNYYKMGARLGHVHAKSLLASRLLNQNSLLSKLHGVYHKATFLLKIPFYVWREMKGHNDKTYL